MPHVDGDGGCHKLLVMVMILVDGDGDCNRLMVMMVATSWW